MSILLLAADRRAFVTRSDTNDSNEQVSASVYLSHRSSIADMPLASLTRSCDGPRGSHIRIQVLE